MEQIKLEKREDGIYVVGQSQWGPTERKLNEEQISKGKLELEEKKEVLGILNGQRESLEEQLDEIDKNIVKAKEAVDEFGDVFDEVEEEVIEEEPLEVTEDIEGNPLP